MVRISILTTLLLVVLASFAFAEEVTMTVEIPDASEFGVSGDFSASVAAADLDAGFKYVANVTTLTIKDNTADWDVTAALDTLPSGYAIHVDDNSDGSSGSTTGFLQLTTSASSLSLANEGAAGSFSPVLDYLISGLEWTDNTDYEGVITLVFST